ncbi:hypothetical protein D3C71_2056430 [compost metagenome]
MAIESTNGSVSGGMAGSYRLYHDHHVSKKRLSKIRLTSMNISQHTRVSPLSLELADLDEVESFIRESSIFS